MSAAAERAPIRVLVCDDSALIRMALKRMIENDAELCYAGFARDGEDAVEKARQLRPDVIVMDVVMPRMDGIAALREIVAQKPAPPVIIFSSSTTEGAERTIEAIEQGAFDCVAKPRGMESLAALEREIVDKIKSAAGSVPGPGAPAPVRAAPARPESRPSLPARRPGERGNYPFKAVALGISTGGPKSIFEVLPLLPAGLPAAVIVVQHMPPEFTGAFAKRIHSRTRMPCVESEAGMAIQPGHIYVARGGYHFKLLSRPGRELLVRQTTEPKHLFMPSVDVMMEAVLECFRADTVGVLMTGMGWDGAAGMLKIHQQGGVTIAESEETAIVFGMPQEAIRRGGAQVVAPHRRIAEEIVRGVNACPEEGVP